MPPANVGCDEVTVHRLLTILPSAPSARVVLATLVVLFSFQLTCDAATLISVDEALDQAFPDSQLNRESLFLTDDQLSRVEAASGIDGQPALVTRFTARRTDNADHITGYAYLDTHRVRTLPETVLIVVDPDATVRRVEVVTFREPMEYLPPRAWYEQVEGRALDSELALKKGIRPITGATLTARATTDAVRRILAVHGIVTATEGATE